MSAVLQFVRGILNWPVKKYSNTHQNVKNLTPYKKWEIVWKLGKFATNVMGLHVLDNCERNWLTPIGPCLGAEQIILTLYTMWYYWSENKVTAIQPLTIMAIIVPVRKYNQRYS